MKLITCLVASTVAVVFAATSHAQVDCAGWNTAAFFRVAGTSDITRCLETGASPDLRDSSGFTPLHWAAALGRAEVVTALSEAGAVMEARAVADVTPLHLAVALGSAEAVTALLEAGANPNVWDENGETPLHRAASLGRAEVVTVLSEAGAAMEAQAVGDATALHLAAALGGAEAVTALLEEGANLEARDNNGWTPLHVAARQGSAEAVTALLAAGADPKARDTNGKLPVDYAADNEQLKGTDVYWKLNDARFQSSGSGTSGDIGTGSGGGIGGGVFRIGGDVSAPRLTYKVEPEYSEEARKAKYQGTVVLAIQVWEDGRAHNIRVIRSLGLGLDEKAIQAVQEWRFVPGKKDGVPVKVHANVEVSFRQLEAGADPAARDEDGGSIVAPAHAQVDCANWKPPVESEVREWRETYLSTKNEYRRDLMRLCFNFPDLVRHPGFFFWPSDRFKDGCKNHYSPNRTLDDSEPRYFATKEGQVTRTYRRGGVVGPQNSRE